MLKKADEFFVNYFGEGMMWLETGHTAGIQQVAVKVTVTGTTVRRFQGGDAVRIKIEFLEEKFSGIPSTFKSGWMFVNYDL